MKHLIAALPHAPLRLPAAALVTGMCLLLAAAPARADLYLGSWTNTTFGSTGGLSLDVQVVGSDVTMIVDVDGFAFGTTDPDPFTMTGTVNGDNSISFDPLSNPMFGDVTASMTAAGVITAQATNIPDARIDDLTFTGQFTAGVGFAGDYTVNFSPSYGGGFAVGTMEAALVPEPATAALLAAGLVALAARKRRQ